MNKEQIEQAIRILGHWKDSVDVMNCVGRSLGYEVIDTAIFALTEAQKTIGKAWIMYENNGKSCPNCLEHLCDDWSFCPECGTKLNSDA